MPYFKKNQTLNCRGRIFMIDRTQIMGVLNTTPDSFYDGGRFISIHDSLLQVESMLKDGADIIDVGGMSSRPGASIISVVEEMDRVLPVIEQINKNFKDVFISIDTVHAETAREAVKAGASIINDISGGEIDNDMLALLPPRRTLISWLGSSLKTTDNTGDLIYEFRLKGKKADSVIARINMDYDPTEEQPMTVDASFSRYSASIDIPKGTLRMKLY